MKKEPKPILKFMEDRLSLDPAGVGDTIGSGNEGAANVMIDGGTIGLKGTKSLPSQCADIGKGQSNSSYAITSVMVKGGSIYITDVGRNPVLAGWKQNENQGWERELPTDGKD
ncbi:MAG: hypothetical protein V8S58_06055 [Lachnospiraceae bacterium]